MTKPSFVYTTYIRTTPEQLWKGLTDPAFTQRYWDISFDTDWKVGSRWSHQDYDTGAVDIVGKVLQSDPPRRLVLTWEGANDKLRSEKPSRASEKRSQSRYHSR